MLAADIYRDSTTHESERVRGKECVCRGEVCVRESEERGKDAERKKGGIERGRGRKRSQRQCFMNYVSILAIFRESCFESAKSQNIYCPLTI